MMNKKGAERLFFLVFILVVLVLAGGIAGGMALFFNQDYNIREAQTNLLMGKVGECLKDNDFFAEGFELYSSCGLNRNFIDEGYGIVISEGGREIIFGTGDLRNRCGLKLVNDKSPFCLNEKITKSGKEYNVFIGSIASPKRRADG